MRYLLIISLVISCSFGENLTVANNLESDITQNSSEQEFNVDTTLNCNGNEYRILISQQEGNSELDKIFIVELFTDSKLFIKKVFESGTFNEFIKDKKFKEKSVLYNFWFESFDCTSKDLNLSAVLTIPESDWSYFFHILINNKKQISINLIEENEI